MDSRNYPQIVKDLLIQHSQGKTANGEFWLLHNTTEHKLAIELMELGVPNSDIVLGFFTPEMRHFTDFGVQ
jgi:hypothetical protein